MVERNKTLEAEALKAMEEEKGIKAPKATTAEEQVLQQSILSEKERMRKI